FRTGPSTTAGCSHRRIRVDVQPLWRKKRCLGTAQDIFALTEPSLLSRGTRPPRALGGLGVKRAFFERNIHLVAECSQRFADRSHGKLEHGSGSDANGGHAPGLEALFHVDDNPLPVKVYGVDGKTHGEGMDAARWANPESLAMRPRKRDQWVRAIRRSVAR